MPLNPLPNDSISDWSKLKAFAGDKINVTEKLKFVLERVENNNVFKSCLIIIGLLNVGLVW